MTKKPQCSATTVDGRRCSRPSKYAFVSDGRQESRCGAHAYDWLSSSVSKPSWVERVEIIR